MKPLKERLLDMLNEYKGLLMDSTGWISPKDIQEMNELLDDLNRAQVVENVRLPTSKRDIG